MSFSRSHITLFSPHTNAKKQYIINQKEHHQSLSFIEEYRQWLIEMGVSPDEPYFPK